MSESGFVYIWFDRKHSRYYVGCHWGPEDDGYICSSQWMRRAYERRPEDFRRRVIARVDTSRKDLLVEEHRWLSMIKDHELKTRYYNLRNDRNGHWSAEDSRLNVKTKISVKTKEAMARPEVREKYLEGLKTRDNKASDPAVIEKKRSAMKVTMEKKWPSANRYKNRSLRHNTPELNAIHAQNTREMWKREGHRESVSKKIAESLKASPKVKAHTAKMSATKWWTNGVINRRCEEQPGETWSRGRTPKYGRSEKSHDNERSLPESL